MADPELRNRPTYGWTAVGVIAVLGFTAGYVLMMVVS